MKARNMCCETLVDEPHRSWCFVYQDKPAPIRGCCGVRLDPCQPTEGQPHAPDCDVAAYFKRGAL